MNMNSKINTQFPYYEHILTLTLYFSFHFHLSMWASYMSKYIMHLSTHTYLSWMLGDGLVLTSKMYES